MVQIPPEILQLRDTYEKAQIRLLDIIAKQEARGNVTAYRKAILAQTNAELKILDDFAVKWAKDNVTKTYTQSVEDVYTAYRAAHISVPVIAANQRVIKSLSENASGQLLDAHRFIGRMIDDNIRKAGIEAITEKVSTGSTVKETKKILIQKLTDKGIMAIKDKAGRNIKLEVYAETVARTTTREATNKGTMQQLQDMGEDLVRMTHHNSSCPLCASYEGRVYSISGKSTEYPALDIPFSGDYANIHPNCGHSLTPYIKQFDDNASDTKAFSNRSFNVNPQSKAQIDSYNKGQKIKADRRADRNEWEEAKLLVPDQVSKTFSGFRAIKRADGEKYNNLKNDIRIVKDETLKQSTQFKPPYFPTPSELGYKVEYLNRKPIKYYGVHGFDDKTIKLYAKGRTPEQVSLTLDHEVGHIHDYKRRGIDPDPMGDSIRGYDGKLRAMADHDIYFRDNREQEAKNIRKVFPRQDSVATTQKEIWADVYKYYKRSPTELKRIAPRMFKEMDDYMRSIKV